MNAAPFAARPFGCELSLQRPLLCPEIELWLMSEQVELEAACRSLAGDAAPPYWAFCWGSGQALARWVLDHPKEVRGRDVADFGAGSGVVAIACGLAGANRSTAVDVDAEAREASLANAAINGVELDASEDLPDRVDLILASDVLYDPSMRARLVGEAHTRFGLLLGEPARPGLESPVVAPLASYAVRTKPDVDSPTCKASVHRIRDVRDLETRSKPEASDFPQAIDRSDSRRTEP